MRVENNATLTIEPGVTIQFTNSGRGGGIHILSGSTIKAVGTADKRIRFLGAYEAAGTWRGIDIQSNTEHQFTYCDFMNMGDMQSTVSGGLRLSHAAKAGISHCKFTNGEGTGVFVSSYGGNCQFTAFNNNVFEGYENYPPMVITPLSLIEKLDMTSDFTKNALKYIEFTAVEVTKDLIINQTTVPYYFKDGITAGWSNTLTVNEGVTIYMAAGKDFASANLTGRFIVNGTASKKVRITRLPGTSEYWGFILFNGLKGSVINHCIFEYGDNIANKGIIQIVDATELTLNNVEINNSNGYGVVIGTNNCNYKLNHSNVTFSGNRIGNVWDGCGVPRGVRTHFP